MIPGWSHVDSDEAPTRYPLPTPYEVSYNDAGFTGIPKQVFALTVGHPELELVSKHRQLSVVFRLLYVYDVVLVDRIE